MLKYKNTDKIMCVKFTCIRSVQVLWVVSPPIGWKNIILSVIYTLTYIVNRVFKT